jgi:hypothetical protein
MFACVVLMKRRDDHPLGLGFGWCGKNNEFYPFMV